MAQLLTIRPKLGQKKQDPLTGRWGVVRSYTKRGYKLWLGPGEVVCVTEERRRVTR